MSYLSPLTVGTPVFDKMANYAGLPTENSPGARPLESFLGYIIRGTCLARPHESYVISYGGPCLRLAHLLFLDKMADCASPQGYELKIFSPWAFASPFLGGGANLHLPFLNFGPGGIALKLTMVRPLLLTRRVVCPPGKCCEAHSSRWGINTFE